MRLRRRTTAEGGRYKGEEKQRIAQLVKWPLDGGASSPEGVSYRW